MADRPIRDLKRTHMCGQLRAEHVGQDVVLFGWVRSQRDKGGVVFIDLRDREGHVQVIFDASDDAAVHDAASKVRSEWVVFVQGTVRSRGSMKNPDLATGEVEVVGHRIEVLNRSEVPPFEIRDDVDTFEEKRLQYRYLDLRRPVLQKNLMLRSKLTQTVRSSLSQMGFLELETPFMVKYTPGGARNFLVPSRLNKGSFYALAESPQLFKQLYMVSGFDRYFQVTRCFRDEDLRQDRQPEFTQVDLELSFAEEEDVMSVMERVVADMFQTGLGIQVTLPFPRMAYDEAMARYGSDKPDLRFGLEHVDATATVREHAAGGNPLLERALGEGGILKLMRVPHPLSRKEMDELESEAKKLGAAGLGRAKVSEDYTWTQSPFAKNTSAELQRALSQRASAEPGDVLLFQFGPARKVHMVLGHLRLHLGHKLGLIPAGTWSLSWVTEFPLFELDESTGRFVAAHHPFTSPREEDVDRLKTDPGACRARAYDLVLNGTEIAGGSVRIHRTEVQSKVFDALSISPEEQRQKFGFLLDALNYGAPPHAGIAAGLDRVVMLLAGASSLRDVIPFPKTTKGLDLMSSAPTPVDDSQLADVHLKLR